MNESCAHLPEAETTLPIVAMPRDGSIPHIPMFMVTKAAPNSFDHAGCAHLQDPLSGMQLLYATIRVVLVRRLTNIHQFMLPTRLPQMKSTARCRVKHCSSDLKESLSASRCSGRL